MDSVQHFTRLSQRKAVVEPKAHREQEKQPSLLPYRVSCNFCQPLCWPLAMQYRWSLPKPHSQLYQTPALSSFLWNQGLKSTACRLEAYVPCFPEASRASQEAKAIVTQPLPTPSTTHKEIHPAVQGSPVTSRLPSLLKGWAGRNTICRSRSLVFCSLPWITGKASDKSPVVAFHAKCSFSPSH